MKHTEVALIPLAPDDREQFILDNQWAFKYGALQEFGKRDDHIDFEGEIISRKTIERCIDEPNSETYGETPLDKSNHKNRFCLAMLPSMAFQIAYTTPMTAGRAATLIVRHGSSWWATLKKERLRRFSSRT